MAVDLAFAPDGKTLAAVFQQGDGTNPPSTEVTLWDPAEGKLLRTVAESDGFHTVAFSPDGKVLFGAGGSKLRAWDARTAKAEQATELRTDFATDSASAATFAPDGRTVAVSGKRGDQYVVTVWDVKAGTLTRTLEGHEGMITSLAFSRDGKTLAGGGEDKMIVCETLPNRRKSGKRSPGLVPRPRRDRPRPEREVT